MNGFLSWPNSDLDDHFLLSPDGLTAIQSKNGNTWRRLQVQNINDDIAVFKSTDGGQTWPEVKTLITSANIGFFDVPRIDFIFNSLTGESVIKFGISPTRTDQIVVNDQGIRLDRWDGNTWTNIWTK